MAHPAASGVSLQEPYDVYVMGRPPPKNVRLNGTESHANLYNAGLMLLYGIPSNLCKAILPFYWNGFAVRLQAAMDDFEANLKTLNHRAYYGCFLFVFLIPICFPQVMMQEADTEHHLVLWCCVTIVISSLMLGVRQCGGSARSSYLQELQHIADDLSPYLASTIGYKLELIQEPNLGRCAKLFKSPPTVYFRFLPLDGNQATPPSKSTTPPPTPLWMPCDDHEHSSFFMEGPVRIELFLPRWKACGLWCCSIYGCDHCLSKRPGLFPTVVPGTTSDHNVMCSSFGPRALQGHGKIDSFRWGSVYMGVAQIYQRVGQVAARTAFLSFILLALVGIFISDDWLDDQNVAVSLIIMMSTVYVPFLVYETMYCFMAKATQGQLRTRVEDCNESLAQVGYEVTYEVIPLYLYGLRSYIHFEPALAPSHRSTTSNAPFVGV